MALENGEHGGGFCKALLWPATSIFVLFFPASTSSSHQSPWDYTGVLGVWLTYFFIFCLVCVLFKALFEFEGTSLFINYLKFFLPWRGTERDTLYDAFHVLNQISGAHRYFSCWAQFTVPPEAWGRGPRRRRWILLARSLLREINALCNIRHMPSIPLAAQTEKFARGDYVHWSNWGWGRGRFIFIMCRRYRILNYLMQVVYSDTFVLAQAGTRSGHFRIFICNSLLSPVPK